MKTRARDFGEQKDQNFLKLKKFSLEKKSEDLLKVVVKYEYQLEKGQSFE